MRNGKYLIILAVIAIMSCNKLMPGINIEDAPRDPNYQQTLVINELMASNHTGLLTSEGKTCDWIEIKNLTDKEVSLVGHTLLYLKETASDSTAIHANSTKVLADSLATITPDSISREIATWQFPDSISIQPGECLVVFASKKGKDKTQDLCCDFKLSKRGCLRLISPDVTILSEMTYDGLLADESCQLLDDGSIRRSLYPTPGFDNDTQGYEDYSALMESQRKSPLRIWQLFSKHGEKDYDWMTVKNTSTQPVELSEYALSDKASKPAKWTFPAQQLLPGQTFRVQFVGKKALANPANVNFKLDEEESVILSHGKKFADAVSGRASLPHTVTTRSEQGQGFYFMSTGDINAAADGTTSRAYRFISETPAMEQHPGVYSDRKTMALTIDTHGHKVHYTTDGTIPTMASPVYKDTIRIDSTSIIRAFAEGNEQSMRSAVMTASFFLNVKHTLPVINIVASNADLFDFNTGIYATGPNASPVFPHVGANYWKTWEKRAHIEFFDGQEGFSTDCGLRIFGGFSRANQKKSFRIILRGEYGQRRLTYDFFDRGQEETLKSFVLRSGSQDDDRCMVRDEFFTSLQAEHSPTLLIQDYRPVALYLNGKYWGLYYLREKINADFVARHLNVSNDSITIIMSKYLERGSMVGFRSLQNYVNTHDMTQQASFDYMDEHIDCQGLIDHFLGQLYTSNTDVGNVRYVYSPDPKGDRKWHWIYYDLDATWIGYIPVATYLNGHREICMQSGLTAALLRNPTFRRMFLERTSHHLHHTYSPANATKVFDRLTATIRPEMQLNCQRWTYLSFEQWEKNIQNFRTHFANKPKAMLDDIRNYLHVTPAEEKKYFSDLGY